MRASDEYIAVRSKRRWSTSEKSDKSDFPEKLRRKKRSSDLEIVFAALKEGEVLPMIVSACVSTLNVKNAIRIVVNVTKSSNSYSMLLLHALVL